MNAAEDQINLAFRRAAEAAFPNINPQNPGALNYFFDLTDAFNILKDPWSKYDLDKSLLAGTYDPAKKYENYTHTEGFEQYQAKDLIYILGEIKREADEAKAAAKKYALTGLAWFLGGLAVTIVTMMGDTGVLAYGAIIFGGYEAIKGLVAYTKVNGKAREITEKCWAQYLRIPQPIQYQQVQNPPVQQ